MPWTCPTCAHTIRAEQLVHPIRCKCGTVDYGGHVAHGLEFISHAQRHRDVLAFTRAIPHDITAVAGLPRSGMFAASILAEQLHLALYSLDQAGRLIRLGSGWRHRAHRDTGRLLVIDDTVASGDSLRRLPPIDRPHLTAAIYCAPQQRHLVDLFHRPLTLPHYLEWNIFNSHMTAGLATDIDGILCPDPPAELLAPERECAYEKWIATAPTWQRPSRPLPLIATGRRRRYRRHTEDWLAARGITYQTLRFPETEAEHEHPGRMKAEAYAADPTATLFVESDPAQAALIASITGKRVICPATATVHN
jgi:orotate phosphoribosyltransferase